MPSLLSTILRKPQNKLQKKRKAKKRPKKKPKKSRKDTVKKTIASIKAAALAGACGLAAGGGFVVDVRVHLALRSDGAVTPADVPADALSVAPRVAPCVHASTDVGAAPAVEHAPTSASAGAAGSQNVSLSSGYGNPPSNTEVHDIRSLDCNMRLLLHYGSGLLT